MIVWCSFLIFILVLVLHVLMFLVIALWSSLGHLSLLFLHLYPCLRLLVWGILWILSTPHPHPCPRPTHCPHLRTWMRRRTSSSWVCGLVWCIRSTSPSTSSPVRTWSAPCPASTHQTHLAVLHAFQLPRTRALGDHCLGQGLQVWGDMTWGEGGTICMLYSKAVQSERYLDVAIGPVLPQSGSGWSSLCMRGA